MKRPLKLSLAIALALSGTNALALGLGTIHVNSKLNQPLDAEIPVVQGTAGEAEGLLVQLAAAEDFDRVGLNRARLSVPLEFSLVKGKSGDMVIKVTSKDPVREPFLDFLVEANWPKGRLLREYTVLLDPPVMAPATGTAAVTAAAPKAPERAPTQPLPESKPKAAPKPSPPAVAAAPRAEKPAAKPAPTAPAPAPAPKHTATAGEYTVEAGDTLSAIARDVRPDESTNINQLMLAMLKQNPNAFYQDNINALKRGAILRIPSADQIKSVGSASEAAAQVRSQIENWQGNAPAKPTLVAETGAPKNEPKAPAPKATAPKTTTSTASTSTSSKTTERLELVPPKAGKETVAMADRPGSSSGSASGSTELKAELARTKEALASREQEATELKSRVKELEDTKGKTDRLITLKDSEIADLQRKLKELQDQQAKAGSKPATTSTTPASTAATTTPAATPPASSTATTTTPSATTTPPAATTKNEKVSKEDIWGTAGSTATTEAKPGTTPATTPASSSTTAGSTPSSTASTTPSSTPPASSTSTPSTTTTASTGTGTTTTPSPTTPGSTPATTTTSPSTTPESPTASTGTSTPTTTPPASTSTTPATKPAASTSPVKPAAKTTVQPVAPPAQSWFDQAWVRPAAIGAVALLLLAGLVSMRRRKAAVATERGSIAGAFGDSPLRGGDSMSGATVDSEEQALREQLQLDPNNLGMHLELLSLLYAERNVSAFEDAAQDMHAQVLDPHQPEWLEVRAMGQELAPHNPLFFDEAAAAPTPFDDEAVTAPHALARLDHDEAFHRHPPEPASPSSTFNFDLDADDMPATHAPVPPAAASETAFNFDNLPPVDFKTEAHREADAALAHAPLPVDDDEFPGEDGVGTKLDLAKAYLDMGDPEGARSMLEEVLAEGNDTQKGEARRLMGEIK